MQIIVKVALLVVLTLALLKYLDVQKLKGISLKKLAVSAVLIRVIYAFLMTASQYLVWNGNELTRIFLTSPDAFLNFRGGYFIFYAWNRFWAGAILAILMAWLFYKFLRILSRYQNRFFKEGEPEFGFLAAVVSGWPGFVVFIPTLFLLVVLTSLVRMLFWKEKYTTLGTAFFLAATAVLLFEPYFLRVLGLGVLKL